ncbi:hypothetical protein OWV82_024337 [Melia azedarach]|uniref:Uncharacterized protein n=1 Tax=Melia azedarach TaxID=155640 RepID=A0ACC1WPK3_MELAZ|nr:hypothetical protein OWV82_024337 [Melia azedarach]
MMMTMLVIVMVLRKIRLKHPKFGVNSISVVYPSRIHEIKAAEAEAIWNISLSVRNRDVEDPLAYEHFVVSLFYKDECLGSPAIEGIIQKKGEESLVHVSLCSSISNQIERAIQVNGSASFQLDIWTKAYFDNSFRGPPPTFEFRALCQNLEVRFLSTGFGTMSSSSTPSPCKLTEAFEVDGC